MGLLKLGSAAIVGSALTLLVISGPGNLGTNVRQATAPLVSTVERGVGSTAWQLPAPAVTVPGAPAIAPAPAIGQQTQQATAQASTETTVRVYQDNRPSVVTVISSVVQPGFRSDPQPTGTGSGFRTVPPHSCSISPPATVSGEPAGSCTRTSGRSRRIRSSTPSGP
jgi:hypothetical protein